MKEISKMLGIIWNEFEPFRINSNHSELIRNIPNQFESYFELFRIENSF